MEFWDDYEHNDPKITYIYENINTKEIEDTIEDELSGCDCVHQCSPEKCLCIQRSGAKYSFSDKSLLNNYIVKIIDNNKPVYECNNNCKCNSQICGNKLVQFGPRKGLKIINTEKTASENWTKGFGLTTEENIESGNFICEYAGEVITQDEARKRNKIYTEMRLTNNYIFCINENFGEKTEKTFIDPTFYGNTGRYINHSCEPNSILIPIRIHDAIPKLCIFAKQLICKKEEITFDYGQNSDSGDFSRNDKKHCLCFSKNCRKYLPFNETIW